jgi:hypothetical protein
VNWNPLNSVYQPIGITQTRVSHSHLHLELGHHPLLCIIAGTPSVQKPLGEVVLVVPLKFVFVGEEAEEDDGLFKREIDLVL